MNIKVIDKLRKNLERALSDEKTDKEEVLRLSMELDEYIVEYMRNIKGSNDKTKK